MKSERLKEELLRAREKANQWTARVRELEKQVIACENSEIVHAVRALTSSPEEVRGLLDAIRAMKTPPSDMGQPQDNEHNHEHQEMEDNP